MNRNNQIDWSDTDRIVSNDTRYVLLDGDWWRESSSWQTRQDGSSELTLMGRFRTRLTGLGGNTVPSASSPTGAGAGLLTSETHSLDALNNKTVSCSYLDRTTHTTTQTTLSPDSTLPAETVARCGLTVSTRTHTGVTTAYAYDALGRQIAQTDGRGNTSQIVYDAQGRVAKTIDPLGNETTYAYDALGRQVAVTDPLDHTVTTIYDAEGRVLAQRGATYPVDYAYDAYGNKVSMTTYRQESDIPMVGGDVPGAPHAGDTTRWLYDEPSGCMTNKLYADGKGPSYSYTPDGKLARRVWARGIVTDYTYDNAGNLTRTEYNDNGVTPTITMSYDRVGNLVNATTAGVFTNLYAYNLYGHCTNEWQNDFNLTRYYDALGRSTGYAINGERQTVLRYDAATGRLITMQTRQGRSGLLTASNGGEFQWTYLPNSDLKSSLTYPNGLTASWAYDANNQLLQVRNATPTNIISQFDYTYDAAGRRIQLGKSGSAFEFDDIVSYGYNARNELTNAVASVDANYRYNYQYDPIGNRETSFERGTNTTYVANELSQYTQIAATGEDAFVPEFDDDGNQTLVKTATGIWSVAYNGENRPVLWTCGTTNIVMSYDRMGRRVTKNDQRFVYDGYLQICNFHSPTPTQNTNYFIWDPTEPVATRPLVWNRDGVLAYYTHDGNKNVREVVFQNNRIAAHSEYSPFGGRIAHVVSHVLENPWCYSCEFLDDELAAIYFNYRQLESLMGRWIVRDLIGETGGVGLYHFVANAPTMYRDFQGQRIHPQFGFAIGEDSSDCRKDLVYYSVTPNNGKDAFEFFARLDNWWSGFAIHKKSDFRPNDKLRRCQCVSSVLVISHGGFRDEGESVYVNWGDSSYYESSSSENISKLFEGVRFCSECAIELRSCYLGRSKYLANRLALKTGCSVKLHEGLVNPYGEPVEE